MVGGSEGMLSVLKTSLFTSVTTSTQARRPINSEAFTTQELKKAGFCVYFITNDIKSGEEVNQKEAYISRSKSQIEEIFRAHPNSDFLIVQKTYENKVPLRHGHIALILTDEKGNPMFDQYGSFQGGSSLGFNKENPAVKVKAKYPSGRSYIGFPKPPILSDYHGYE